MRGSEDGFARYLLPPLTSRRDYFLYLDHHSVEAENSKREHIKSFSPVKSYLLDVDVSDDNAVVQQFRRIGYALLDVEESLYVVTDAKRRRVGLLEATSGRSYIFYTLLPVRVSDQLVGKFAQRLPAFDQTWFASPVFSALWKRVQHANSPARFVRLGFEFASAYDASYGDSYSDGAPELDEYELDEPVDSVAYEDNLDEYRSSRFAMSERIGRVSKALQVFSGYDPLKSIVLLRLPASYRGGHDLYYQGKITNRSESFQDHRITASGLSTRYAEMTDKIEELASIRFEQESTAIFGPRLRGAPVTMRFENELSEVSFNRWIDALRKPNNRFKLSGIFRRLGPKKVQLVGLDKHMWQAVNLELTSKHVLIMLPDGACGNIVNRLLTNLQRFVDPAVTASVGSYTYEQLASVFSSPRRPQ